MRSALRTTAVALTAALAACSTDSSVAPATQPADLGGVLAQITGAAQLGALGGTGGTPLPSQVTPANGNCAYSAASQSFVCPVVSASGLSFTQSYSLFDAAGKTQSAFDATTTASVKMTTSATGTSTSTYGTLAMDMQQSVTMSGLLTNSRVLNGTSKVKESGSLVIGDGVAQPFSATVSQAMNNLVEPVGSTWPVSGNIVMDLTSSYTMTASPVTMHTDMQFTGGNKALITTTIGSLSTRCTVDLTHPLTPACL